MDTPTIIALLGFQGLTVFLVKQWITAAVKNEYDQRLEKLKSELSRDSFRYSHVFKKTEEVIATVYKHIVELQNATAEFTNDIEVNKIATEKGSSLLTAMVEANLTFANYYFRHRIYVPPSAIVKIEKFVGSIHGVTESYIGLVGLHTANLSAKSGQPQNTKEITETVEKLKELNRQLAKLLRELESEFQQIFGIPEPQKKSG